MTAKTRILIVDDESQIARVLKTGLTAHGYEAQIAYDGVQALETFYKWQPDLVVTDLAMPNMNGLELCKNIRLKSLTPIIVLSVRGEEKTKVEALDAGADDYITKPFGIDELLARIRAVSRRSANDSSTNQTTLSVGDFHIELDSRQVKVGEKDIHLTPKEYDLLVYFVNHPEKVLTQQMLLRAVWGGDHTEQAEYLRVFVGQLRKKIESDPSQPQFIITEPWIGYRFKPFGNAGTN